LRLPAFLASRFVAGETPESAIHVGKALHARGIRATFDLLGEDVHDRASAERAAAGSIELLRKIPDPLERNVSIKLTNAGLDVSKELCLELTAGILEAAREVGGFVRIDMEGSAHTQATLDVFRKLRERHDNVGCVLQAALRRTEADVDEAIQRGERVRLCKGAYREPPQIAYQAISEVRESFRRCAEKLLEGGAQPAIATHDESLILHTLEFVRERGIDPDRFELQMLYGLRPSRWDSLVADGYRVRVYVPYGTHWLPYFYRRLRERKENVLFVLRTLFRG
jgi:proline dehydrogenase